ncbi:MAG TPA: galactokinase [Candidatus Limadaptatus stercoripullorum]|uniref:Galactokinase n=1 Tax=Candidatus Limadaptatus stercoripullorum TaxID=2840846 RepID=A0A9D1SWC4_9FIRM|nr:galactokinase [Candidatus Limadaptatus stercoripullorum]
MDAKNFCAETLAELYGAAAEDGARRLSAVARTFEATFGRAPADLFSSPGRIEIVGNHTDHNAGKVLAAAVNVDTVAAVSPREDGVIEVKSEDYPPMLVELSDVSFKASELGTSAALIKGVADFYMRAGVRVGGFSACMTSTVPRGSGMSSSSSFELMIAEILNVYYNSGSLDPVFKARASQYAENVYFGKPSGLMDQTAISVGGVNMIDFRDFERPEFENAKWSFDDLDIFVAATGGDHSDLTDDYAAIPAEMKAVAEAMGGKLLRDIDPAAFYAAEDGLRSSLSPRALLRAEHFFEENVRVEQAAAAIASGDEKAFLDAVNASGMSSAVKLQNLRSSRGDRALEDALDFAGTLDGVAAKRVHGGGFAGTILLFVRKASSCAVKDALIRRFGADNVFELSVRSSGATRVVHL